MSDQHPVLIAHVAGKTLVRLFASRADVLALLETDDPEDVLFADGLWLRVEVSVHPDAAAAVAACEREVTRFNLTLARPGGEA